ncbi:UDP-N-acetylmuramoyl-tripeptide--D-alanyl-D-alanine ligase [Sulfoacidibacillus thermotolerans]|uniref:UDP-N-acetylmuramoyl-tripeptide--D-alanyl-D-alanine ligase n=1 Tax=Sulfoacidibacillus thermotolerans TaxID=1765684 RepID=A0A2U3D8V2_SULT2|nr:UDP-N-acetylmuramoyl-tripeptide--D-alanyl-D-alanine ligase [Sulfoacidibacillus thermotolerans]PWI57706.1 hypothetical protein BM613_06880 [Sulfoacidibacillus thermotolerans]
MIRATFREIATVLHVASPPPPYDGSFTGVSTDSRSILPGQLYVPLRGEQFDGHAFVRDALHRGASGFLWQENISLPEDLSRVLHLVVPDTLHALQMLAAWYRQSLSVFVIGITGSNGKTSTKDLVAEALSVQYVTYKTEGNFNNHIGLPLSILRLAPETQIAILEMGMSARGEIARLCEIARPDLGIITNIGEAHIGLLGSRENIARAKWELIESLGPRALAILPDDEPLLDALPVPNDVCVWRVGETKDAVLRLKEYQLVGTEGHFTVCPDQVPVRLPIPGKHQARNALCAFAAAKYLGVDLKLAAHAMERATLTKMRMEITDLSDRFTVINDAYNAAPTSTLAALAVLRDMPGDYRIAVLGDMMELGQESERLHEQVGAQAAHLGVDVLLAVGEFSAAMTRGANGVTGSQTSVLAASDVEQAWELLQSLLTAAKTAGKIVLLLKASRKMKFEEMAKRLEQETS